MNIHLGKGTQWEGIYKVLKVNKTFKNGSVSVTVNFKGKNKVFHVDSNNIKGK